ncbi:MAG: hypothetical protein K0S39_1268 [Paenibacillus sp.]|jgi:hypothetical protein|nr:hypothetical protein [Paenibacillus sp.]
MDTDKGTYIFDMSIIYVPLSKSYDIRLNADGDILSSKDGDSAFITTKYKREVIKWVKQN